MFWTGLALGCFLAARSDEVFASDAGIADASNTLPKASRCSLLLGRCLIPMDIFAATPGYPRRVSI